MDIQLKPNESIEDLQLGGLRLIQKTDAFRYGMDSVLLADFAALRPEDTYADFGTGTGILPLLLTGRHKGRSCHAFEINPEMAGLAVRNTVLNRLEESITVHACSVEEAPVLLAPCSVDAVVSNPPYGRPGATLRNPDADLSLARHQGEDTLHLFLTAAFRILKGKGKLFLVYPASDMLLLMDACREAHLEPKHFRLIYPYADRPARLVLLEAVKDAKAGLHPMPPLIVYRRAGEMTDELKRIYHLERT